MPTPYPETWEWNGQSWNQLTPATMPTACYASAVACETDKNLVLLFGGVDANTGNEVSQTWVWDGSSWNQPSLSPSPQGRHLHAMAYDSNRKVVVLFGGFTTSVPSGKRADLWDTWEWNGINWTELHPIHSPSAGLGCLRHGMAYDAKQKVVVMFGGCQDTDTSGNPLPKLVPQTHTWEWNGNDWKDDGPNNNPPWRNSGAMAYNGRNVIVFGGYDANNNYLKDTWSWNGTAWTQLNVSQKPAGATLERTEHAMAFDPARNRIVLFGGETGPAHPASILGDTWELQWTPFPWLFQ